LGNRPSRADPLECQSSWRIENITESKAKEDLISAEAAFNKVIDSSDDFAKLVKGKMFSKVLIDDYRMGAIEICRQENNCIKWTEGFPRIT